MIHGITSKSEIYTEEAACRVALPDNLIEKEATFDRWCAVLLLDGLQRAGWFLRSGSGASAPEVAAASPGATLGMVLDFFSILVEAGLLQVSGDRLLLFSDTSLPLRTCSHTLFLKSQSI